MLIRRSEHKLTEADRNVIIFEEFTHKQIRIFDFMKALGNLRDYSS